MTDNSSTKKPSPGQTPKTTSATKRVDKMAPKTTRDLNPAGAKSGYQTR
jgi:hypothetical protein